LGIAVLGVIATGAGLWWDAQGQNAEWVFWVGVSLFGAVAIGYPVLVVVRRLTTLLKRGRQFEELQSTISTLGEAAGGWQVRAEHAEARLDDWDSETLSRGRSRAIGELMAAAAATEFGETGLVRVPPNDEVAIFAKVTGGALPPVRAVFFLEGRVAHDVKAIVRCARHHDSETVVFEVEAYKSLTQEDLLAAERTIGALPPNLAITHRQLDNDFTNER
jgi:hypothetical protein